MNPALQTRSCLVTGWLGRIFGNREQMDESLSPKRGDLFVCIDVETTGLNSKRDRVIEIGAIRVNPSISSHPIYQTLVQPGVDIPPKITEITGITANEIDEKGIPPSIAFNKLHQFVGTLPIIAYNASFDSGFLSKEWGRLNLSSNHRYFDVLALARERLDLPSYKLVHVAEHLGIEVRPDHRALQDAHVTLLVYDKLSAMAF